MSLAAALLLPVAASLPPDLAWFYLGRQKGGKVLGFLCRLSLEPDSCVRDTENVSHRNGPRALLLAKFIPSFSTVRLHWRVLSACLPRRLSCMISAAH